ncbi:MAG: S8 family peptidase [Candidatus Thorarchaeota archaeon]
MALDDYVYWQPAPRRKQGSNSRKALALLIITMLAVTGIFVVVGELGILGSPAEPVRVAVLDSGLDPTLTTQGRVVAERSFVRTQYGYIHPDPTTTDSKPEGVPHGSIIAGEIAESPNTLLINGKVMGQDGVATTAALVAAMEWAIEQGAKVISMSLGAEPTYGDPLEEAVREAFYQGVIVVASAGNEGDSGQMGTTIGSPSVFEHAISVAALYSDGAPAYYSSIGPTVDRYLKPDLIAQGWATFAGSTYHGTSFSAPRVAAAAAELIGYCMAYNISYTAGSITAALLKGATPMPSYPNYVVGAGKLNKAASLDLLLSGTDEGELPAISYAYPGTLPIEYEHLFEGDTYEFYVRLVTSGNTTFTTSIDSLTPEVFDIPSTVFVNQSTLLPVRVDIPDPSPTTIAGTITFTSSDFGATSVEFSTTVSVPVARIAFDISHTPWTIDSYFGQFRELYLEITSNDISVTEIRNGSLVTLSYLQTFDMVAILDPCVWGANETNPLEISTFSIPFTPEQTQAYEDYFNAGGGIFVATLSNDTTDIASLNDFLSWTGFSMTDLTITPGSDPEVVTEISPHIMTSGVSLFHYLGGTINVPVGGHQLATLGGFPVLGYMEDTGRFVLTGTNYFIDNYGMTGGYGAGDDARLALRIVLWTAGLLV